MSPAEPVHKRGHVACEDLQESQNARRIFISLNYKNPYVDPLIRGAIATLPAIVSTSAEEGQADLNSPCLIWRQYEELPFERAIESPTTVLINSYVYRKALIRKHYLAATVRNWIVKHPGSPLRHRVQPSVDFELDYAEFLDDALMEAEGDELLRSLEINAELQPEQREWWILKAGMAERGGGIRIFSTMEDLQRIFEAWDPESDDEDDENARINPGKSGKEAHDEGIVTSQMRHFVAQRYLPKPLLLREPFESANKKFHVRTYVVAVGALKVYVYKRMLALFAAQAYQPPWQGTDPNDVLSAHLTNTCLQTGQREGSVHDYWSLPSSVPNLDIAWKDKAFQHICETTGTVFEAAAKDMMIHFQPMPNAFEIFGLDFLVDEAGGVWLLEVNAFPDFAQTGEGLRNLIAVLFQGVVETAVKPFFGLPAADASFADAGMIEVLDLDLGRR